MPIQPKNALVLAGLVGGLLYLAQNYTIRGLQHLRIEPLAGQSSQSLDGGWSVADRASLMRPATANSSVQVPASSQTALGFPQGPQPTFPSLAPIPKPVSLAPPVISSIPSARPVSAAPSAIPTSATLKIASFNLHHFGQQKAENPFVLESLAKLLRQYEVVALQDIRTKQQDIMPRLVEQINRSDRHFEYVIGPRVGKTDPKSQLAFLFDTDRIETDRYQLYSVDDPDDLLNREPLVGWFRSKQLPPEAAFTFTLVNVQLDSERPEPEIQVLPELVRSIQRDGRSEDDILLVGDFGTSDRSLQFLRTQGMIFALEGVPTTTQGNAMLDNIVMPARSTDEFTGRAGVFDFLRNYNLSNDQAHQISDHLPVWAEFTAHEGGELGKRGQ
jgi:deoxyribonuclease-1-like protein